MPHLTDAQHTDVMDFLDDNYENYAGDLIDDLTKEVISFCNLPDEAQPEVTSIVQEYQRDEVLDADDDDED